MYTQLFEMTMFWTISDTFIYNRIDNCSNAMLQQLSAIHTQETYTYSLIQL